MKTVGFIDYFLNEWHADNYPAWIAQQTGGEMAVKYAWAMTDPFDGDRTNAAWAARNGVELCATIDEVVEKSDYIVVLSPDNPEFHVALSEKALKSGKPVYIDKTFANSREEAAQIFALAEACGSPCFSSSALRFSQKLAAVDTSDINFVISTAGGPIENYIIHQIEPLCILMGTAVDRVMYTGNPDAPAWIWCFGDGRTASFHLLRGGADFRHCINRSETNEELVINDDFFQDFIAAMLHFFRTGEIPVSHEDTIAIMAIRAACLKAMKAPTEWVKV